MIDWRYLVALLCFLLFCLFAASACDVSSSDPQIFLEMDVQYEDPSGRTVVERRPANGVFAAVNELDLLKIAAPGCTPNKWDWAYPPSPYCDGPGFRIHGRILGVTNRSDIQSLAIVTTQYRRDPLSGDMLRCLPTMTSGAEAACPVAGEAIPLDRILQNGSEFRFEHLVRIPLCPSREGGKDVAVKQEATPFSRVVGVTVCEPSQMVLAEIKLKSSSRVARERATVVTPLDGQVVKNFVRQGDPLTQNAALWVKREAFDALPPLELKNSCGDPLQLLTDPFEFEFEFCSSATGLIIDNVLAFLNPFGGGVCPGTECKVKVRAASLGNGPVEVSAKLTPFSEKPPAQGRWLPIDPETTAFFEFAAQVKDLGAEFMTSGLSSDGTITWKSLELQEGGAFDLFLDKSAEEIDATLLLNDVGPGCIAFGPTAAFSGTGLNCDGGVCENVLDGLFCGSWANYLDPLNYLLQTFNVLSFDNLDTGILQLVNIPKLVQEGIYKSLDYRTTDGRSCGARGLSRHRLGDGLKSGLRRLFTITLARQTEMEAEEGAPCDPSADPPPPLIQLKDRFVWFTALAEGVDAGLKTRIVPIPDEPPIPDLARIYYPNAHQPLAREDLKRRRAALQQRTPAGSAYMVEADLQVGAMNEYFHAAKEAGLLEQHVRVGSSRCIALKPSVAPVVTMPDAATPACPASILSPASPAKTAALCANLPNYEVEVFETVFQDRDEKCTKEHPRTKVILKAGVDLTAAVNLGINSVTGQPLAITRSLFEKATLYAADSETPQPALDDYVAMAVDTVYLLVREKFRRLKLPLITPGVQPKIIEVAQGKGGVTFYFDLTKGPAPLSLVHVEDPVAPPGMEISFPVQLRDFKTAGVEPNVPSDLSLSVIAPPSVNYSLNAGAFETTGSAQFRWRPNRNHLGTHAVEIQACSEQRDECSRQMVQLAGC